MLVIKLEVWPGGDRLGKRKLGQIRISNLVWKKGMKQKPSGKRADVAAYSVAAQLDDHLGKESIDVQIDRFDRRDGAWALAFEAVNTVLLERRRMSKERRRR